MGTMVPQPVPINFMAIVFVLDTFLAVLVVKPLEQNRQLGGMKRNPSVGHWREILKTTLHMADSKGPLSKCSLVFGNL